MTRRGFTLVEVLICIAIVALLAAILMPVFARAKESAMRAKSIANLRQIGVLINLYRDEHGGTATGSPDDMGLPVGDAFHDLWNTKARRFRAPQRGPVAPYFDYYYYVPGYGGNAWSDWARYTEKVSGQAVIMADFTFNSKRDIEMAAHPKLGYGLFIDTAVKTKRRAADPAFPAWWHDELP